MENINDYIEHTVLKPTTVDADIEKIAKEARDYKFKGICVPPFWVKKAKRELGDSEVLLVTVIGFPLGYNMTETKLAEIDKAIADGADELDVVMNISAFKAGMPWVKIELAKCANLSHEHGKLVKVIIETAYLSEEEIVRACHLCAEAGVDIVKTSTGFAGGGAKVAHIKLMRDTLPANVGIKASGGIKNYEQAKAMIDAGADRLGVSSGIDIVESMNK